MNRSFWFTLWIIVLQIIAISIFLQGFLLTRKELSTKSKCSDNPGELNFGSQNKEGCWHKPQYKRAIFFIIDALRFDMVSLEKEITPNYYQNEMKFVQSLLRNQPQNSLLLKFIADPPTTTMQRLKGLTTGGLPTFIDQKSNFQSTEIEEDNYIHLLAKLGKNITLLGDDTWYHLFPTSFQRAFPFDSFNTKDLYSVDNGIKKHLMKEFGKEDWSLLIAHFLGADHCAHTYEVNHPKMREKLKEYDRLIKSIVEKMDEDTILFIYGDHGITLDGNHGGGSVEEVEAGLVVYSKKDLFWENDNSKDVPEISQIDLVPTFSLLLGIPIPNGNLGKIIPELFKKDDHLNILSQVYNINAAQVIRYLNEYSELSEQFPKQKMQEFNKQFKLITEKHQNLLNLEKEELNDSKEEFQNITNEYLDLLQKTIELCHKMWTTFDLNYMVFGIILLVCCWLPLIFQILFSQLKFEFKFILFGFLVGLIFIPVQYFVLADISYSLFLFGPSICSLFAFFISIYKNKNQSQNEKEREKEKERRREKEKEKEKENTNQNNTEIKKNNP